MRQLFTVGPVLAAIVTSFALHAQSLPLLDLELGAAERQDLLRLASADTPAEMMRLLVNAHRDLELRTLSEDDGARLRFRPRFQAGPRAVLTFAADVDRAEIFNGYLRYLIDRVRLRQSPTQTIARGKSFHAWMAEKGARAAGLDLRHALESFLYQHGEDIEIVLYLRQHAPRLHLGSLRQQVERARSHLGPLVEEWQRLAYLVARGEGVPLSSVDLRRFSDTGVRIGETDEVFRSCGEHL